jgi:hypothetical protein
MGSHPHEISGGPLWFDFSVEFKRFQNPKEKENLEP